MRAGDVFNIQGCDDALAVLAAGTSVCHHRLQYICVHRLQRSPVRFWLDSLLAIVSVQISCKLELLKQHEGQLDRSTVLTTPVVASSFALLLEHSKTTSQDLCAAAETSTIGVRASVWQPSKQRRLQQSSRVATL